MKNLVFNNTVLFFTLRLETESDIKLLQSFTGLPLPQAYGEPHGQIDLLLPGGKISCPVYRVSTRMYMKDNVPHVEISVVLKTDLEWISFP